EHLPGRVERHGQRSKLDALAAPGRIVLESVAAGLRVGRDGADALVPEADFDDGGVHAVRVCACFGCFASGRRSRLPGMTATIQSLTGGRILARTVPRATDAAAFALGAL